jgi:5-methylcytosine-specific restriction protein A
VKFTDDVRKVIQSRAKDRCEICGSLALYHQIHHRRPRGMGGSKDPVVGSAANGIWVHPHCHSKIESERERARENGWLVPQASDPSKVPFKKYNGWVMLNEDGTYTMVKSPDNLGGE